MGNKREFYNKLSQIQIASEGFHLLAIPVPQFSQSTHANKCVFIESGIDAIPTAQAFKK